MQKSKAIIYPRIIEEVVDYAELQKVWNCGYLVCYRILSGQTAPNHVRKKQLADYLGIPVNELWVKKGDQIGNPTQTEVSMTSEDPEYEPLEQTEEEKLEHTRKYQHEYYLTTTKPKRAEQRRQKALLSQDSVTSEDSEIISESTEV